MTIAYTSDSWERMTEHPGDRTADVRSLVESLGGTLEYHRWELGTTSAYAIFDAPDVTASQAVTLVMFKTGAYERIRTHELYPQRELIDVLTLARDAAKAYQVPGQDAIRNP